MRRSQLVTPEHPSSARLVSRFSIAAAVSVVVVTAMQFGVRHVVSRQDTHLADALLTDEAAVNGNGPASHLSIFDRRRRCAELDRGRERDG
jgi:hypothetical protein